MSSIQDRFKRTYKLLEEVFSVMSKEDITTIRKEGINLMTIRNKAGLWGDYEEDISVVIDGYQVDPNHPDNLSSIVWESFKNCHLGWFDKS